MYKLNPITGKLDYYLAPGEIRKYNQLLTGTINDVNTVFTTPDNFIAGSTRIVSNQLTLALGVDYTETGTNEITFTAAPTTTPAPDIIRIDYNLA